MLVGLLSPLREVKTTKPLSQLLSAPLSDGPCLDKGRDKGRDKGPRPGLLRCLLRLRTSHFALRTCTLIIAFLGAAALSLPAQAPPPRPPDPLMSLMLAQPKMTIPEVTQATVAFDPPVVRPGELTFYRVVFNALEDSIEWPTNVVGPAELEIRPGARGEILQMSATNMEPRAAFNCRVRASRTGSFTVPAFAVKVAGKEVTVPTARLEVVNAPLTAVTAQQLRLELTVTNLFVGEPVTARILSPASPAGVVQGLGLPQLIGNGILVDLGGVRQRVEMVQRGGVAAPTFIYETTLRPVLTGKLSVFAQGFTSGSVFSGPVMITGPAVISGGRPQYVLLESDPVELNVRPLPQEGELPGFTGAIGRFTAGPPRLATNVVRVGEPVKLSVTITNRGNGPLARLVPPPAPRVSDWQVLGASDFAPAQPVMPAPTVAAPSPASVEGVVTFNYTLVPLTEQVRATPAIPFSYFDPSTGAYADLTIPPVAVTVVPGLVPGDFASLQHASALEEKPEKELTLSGLAAVRGRTAASLVPLQERAWFPFVQLAPAACFLGLWVWDRRRRYLEGHPEVILRRQARRALRRHRRTARRAARAADATHFGAAAVNALRAACAPHYPAEPRALVGGDVLQLLPEVERVGRGGEVVRRFFAVTDAAEFSTAKPNAAELFRLQPELERVLQQLEQRL